MGAAEGRTGTSDVPRVRSSEIAISGSEGPANLSTGGRAEPQLGSADGHGEGVQGSPLHVTPWQSETWISDIAEANRKIEEGQVPDSYRDLLRAYFSPERK